MKKNVFLLVLLCSLIVISTLASKNVDNSSKKDNKSTSYLSSIRLAQVKKQFNNLPNSKSMTVSNDSDEVHPMTPLSANIGSICALSGCVGSVCSLSGCVISVCGASGCVGSACGVVSVCKESVCGGSVCSGSTCVGSVCSGSACTHGHCAKGVDDYGLGH